MTSLVRAIILALAASLPLASFTFAQASLPPRIQKSVQDARDLCSPDSATLGNGFVSRKDINGDGASDYILNYEAFRCGENSSFFCGSGGCKTEAFVALPTGDAVKVLDEIVYSVDFKSVKGRPAMLLSLHGMACGRVGAEGCKKTRYWNGQQFKAGR